MPKIVWNGTSLAQERNEGYKNSEDAILSRVRSLGIDIEQTCLIPSDVKQLISTGIGLQYESEGVNVDADILINNRLPNDYSFCNGYNIGFSYWETSKLPQDWVRKMNLMDEIWTTSLWAKNVFINSGVDVPVKNFRLGIDKDLYFPVLKSKPHFPFTFLSIGSPSTRKNSQVSVDAFIELFGDNDNYKLIYKSTDAPDARIYKNNTANSLYNHPNIEVIDRDLTANELSQVYDRADCVLYPTSGEGWGLLPYQGIAKGIPTICTNATACTEYAELSVPLDYRWSNVNMSGIYSGCGEWAEPDYDDFCDKILYVVNNYDQIAKQTYENAVKNFEKMTWDFAAKEYSDSLCQILKI